MKGKDKCRILKDIRRSIAEANGIALITEECKHKGECKGTCPRCESEVAYLERELEKKRTLGKTVAVAGLAIGIGISMTGCADIELSDLCFDSVSGTQAGTESGKRSDKQSEEHVEVDGEIAIDTQDEVEVGGMIPLPPETTDIEIMGDIAYLPIPEIDRVLELGEFELESSLSYKSREEILDAWGRYIADTAVISGDKFLIPSEAGASITVFYNKQGYVTSFDIDRKG